MSVDSRQLPRNVNVFKIVGRRRVLDILDPRELLLAIRRAGEPAPCYRNSVNVSFHVFKLGGNVVVHGNHERLLLAKFNQVGHVLQGLGNKRESARSLGIGVL